MKTDSQLQTDVLAELKWQPSVNAAHIGVTAKDNAVTLTGQVGHYTEKIAAQDAAKRVYSVKAVNNYLSIKPTAKWIDVKSKIEEAFRRSADMDARRITVETHDGKVTLSGSVSSWKERNEAMVAAWAAPGVTSVKDLLAVTL